MSEMSWTKDTKWETYGDIAEAMAKHLDDDCIYATASDIASELSQWCVREITGKTLEKSANSIELYDYIYKMTIMLMVLVEKHGHNPVADAIEHQVAHHYYKEFVSE
jgi:hypothetical protein